MSQYGIRTRFCHFLEDLQAVSHRCRIELPLILIGSVPFAVAEVVKILRQSASILIPSKVQWTSFELVIRMTVEIIRETNLQGIRLVSTHSSPLLECLHACQYYALFIAHLHLRQCYLVCLTSPFTKSRQGKTFSCMIDYACT